MVITASSPLLGHTRPKPAHPVHSAVPWKENQSILIIYVVLAKYLPEKLAFKVCVCVCMLHVLVSVGCIHICLKVSAYT